jgi:hypothetical protein
VHTIGGRIFSDETVQRIAQVIVSEPAISRRRLSQRVCEWLGWRNAAGRLQEMSCRKALLQLNRLGVIHLPELKKTYSCQTGTRAVAPPPITPVSGALGDLGKLELVRVARGALSVVWRGMLDAYHYLKSGPLCGAQLRYLVRSERVGWVGALSYSACALRVESRDVWIGWSEQARRLNLNRVVNNSRFLVPPMVKVKDLASHVLSLGSGRLAEDWEQVYGYRPVLLETDVERGRFQGSCYAGAGWSLVGTTTGRGRQGSGATVKDVYVQPLDDHWRTKLCCVPGQATLVRVAKEDAPPRDWLEEELGRADLGDRRLTARLLQMTGQFYERPLANLPQACGSPRAVKAAYRFLDNEQVQWQAIMRSHYEATQDRLHQHELVLVAQDTTTLNYSSHPHTQGLGPIGTDSENVRGLMVHDTLCFTPNGTPLGLLDVQCWAREGIGSKAQRHKKPIEDKESWKWVQSYRAVSAVQKRCPATRLVMVADREADLHELFVEQLHTRHGADLLIRAERSRNRKVLDEEENHEYLWTILERQKVVATRALLIPPGENRAARQALLDVRMAPVTLQPPKTKSKLPTVALWAVLAREPQPPAGVEGLEWMLLSTVETTRQNDALTRLEWYAKRWGIEVFHRILKSGCRVERRQLENAQRLCTCLAIDMVVAWRIFHLTMQGREAPEVTSAVYFTPAEWKALVTFVHKNKTPPSEPPSLNEAIALLAQLGGHLGRTGDDLPGCEVLWRGRARLADISEAYTLYH